MKKNLQACNFAFFVSLIALLSIGIVFTSADTALARMEYDNGCGAYEGDPGDGDDSMRGGGSGSGSQEMAFGGDVRPEPVNLDALYFAFSIDGSIPLVVFPDTRFYQGQDLSYFKLYAQPGGK